jgi:hypothetical protein
MPNGKPRHHFVSPRYENSRDRAIGRIVTAHNIALIAVRANSRALARAVSRSNRPTAAPQFSCEECERVYIEKIGRNSWPKMN